MTPHRPSGQLIRRVQRRLLWAGVIANAVGIFVVFAAIGFLIPIFLDAGERGRLALLNGPIVLAVFVTATLITTRINRRYEARALSWIWDEREPDAEEHRLTLRWPLRLARVTALSWVASAPLLVAVNAPESIGFALVIGAEIAAGGLTTAALVYLLCERIMRPVTARALGARLPSSPAAPGVRGRLLVAWALGTGIPVFNILVVGLVGATKGGVDATYVAGAALFLGAVAIGVSLLATTFVAHAISDPVVSVRRALERVEDGDFGAQVAVDDGSEVGLMQAGFNRMAAGLREREQIRDLFGRHVGKEVARAALRDGTRLGGEEREVGALFIDLVGSTGMAVALPPNEVVRLLNVFFRVVVEAIEAEGGFVNKFEGDAALCVFGAPAPSEDPAGEALGASRALAERLGNEVPSVDFGIGVSAGRAVAGNVGAEQRFEYTVIGDPVNEAARLSELAKQQPGRILASDSAVGRAHEEESAAWSYGEETVLRGRTAATRLAQPQA